MQEHPTAVEAVPEPVFSHSAPIPEPRGDHPAAHAGMDGNGSGTGVTAVLPEELRGFNWPAFLLNWIWSLGHNTWIGLLAIVVPFPIMQIILGIKGNEWAWQNRKWDSVEQFRTTQRVWLMWGLGVLILTVLLVVGVIALAIWIAVNTNAASTNAASTTTARPFIRN